MDFAQAAGTATQGSIWGSLAWLLAMFAIFYFLLIRPQQKRTKKRNEMISSVKKNDRVVTVGGVHGTVVEINDDTIVLRVNENSKITFDKSAVNNVIGSEE